MTGQLFLDKGDILVPKHCHWLIHLDGNEQLRYVDSRRFGKAWHYMEYNDALKYVQSKLGPEIWDINAESFILITRQPKYSNKILKDLLLDQKYIAGIGNIYASEICYESFIDPNKLIHELTDKQIEHIYYNIKKVLEKAIKNRGTTLSDYRTGNNKKGNNQNFLRAYKQVRCNRCSLDFTKNKIKGRMSYYCKGCQK